MSTKIHIQMAKLLDYEEKHEAAIEHLQKAQALVAGTKDQYLKTVVLGNLATSYVWAGNSREALTILPEAFTAYEGAGSRLSSSLLRWIAGVAEQLQGRNSEAERHLLLAREGLKEVGEEGYWGMICLELAVFYQGNAQPTKASNMAASALPALRKLELPELLCALDILQKSIVAGTLTMTVLLHARDIIRRLYRDPNISLVAR